MKPISNPPPNSIYPTFTHTEPTYHPSEVFQLTVAPQFWSTATSSTNHRHIARISIPRRLLSNSEHLRYVFRLFTNPKIKFSTKSTWTRLPKALSSPCIQPRLTERLRSQKSIAQSTPSLQPSSLQLSLAPQQWNSIAQWRVCPLTFKTKSDIKTTYATRGSETEIQQSKDV